MENKRKSTMSEAAKEARRAYMRDWERKNKAKRAAYRNAYWERKARGTASNAAE